eukprot:Hpha_TRINITY_DN12546_c0_g1::TRINITY_DN12546_c0_g1_i1::g.51182::m.51182
MKSSAVVREFLNTALLLLRQPTLGKDAGGGPRPAPHLRSVDSELAGDDVLHALLTSVVLGVRLAEPHSRPGPTADGLCRIAREAPPARLHDFPFGDLFALAHHVTLRVRVRVLPRPVRLQPGPSVLGQHEGGSVGVELGVRRELESGVAENLDNFLRDRGGPCESRGVDSSHVDEVWVLLGRANDPVTRVALCPCPSKAVERLAAVEAGNQLPALPQHELQHILRMLLVSTRVLHVACRRTEDQVAPKSVLYQHPLPLYGVGGGEYRGVDQWPLFLAQQHIVPQPRKNVERLVSNHLGDFVGPGPPAVDDETRAQ